MRNPASKIRFAGLKMLFAAVATAILSRPLAEWGIHSLIPSVPLPLASKGVLSDVTAMITPKSSAMLGTRSEGA